MDVDTASNIGRLRHTLQVQLRQHAEDLAALAGAGTDPGSAGEDPHTVAARTVAARRAIEEITAALSRITDGVYGRCERCTDPIPHARLEILPHARFCVPCQAREP